MLNKRVQTEIDTFYSKIFNLPDAIRKVSASAFTQCRDKILFTAFLDVHRNLISYYYKHFRINKFHGYRLIAIDGSTFTLPKTKDMITEFGENVLSEHGKWLKAKVSFAADVLNNICVEAQIGAYKSSETAQAKDLINQLGNNNLYLFDRGYFTWDFFEHVVESGCQYCFRVKRNACQDVISFVRNQHKNKWIDITTPSGLMVKVRLAKVLLPTGEEEYLLTSLLDEKQFSLNKLKHLYHLRWGVEEQFKDIKHAISMENFTGKKVNSVKQEFYANILTYNLAMMMCKPIIDRQIRKNMKRTYNYKTNKRALLAKIKQCFVSLFYYPNIVLDTLNQLIKAVTLESVPIRKGRRYKRSKTYKAKLKFTRAYTPVI